MLGALAGNFLGSAALLLDAVSSPMQRLRRHEVLDM
jgi:hypothetical protein